jgi:cystathionine beta-lyase/cystathionine gamma-synthase
MIDPGLPYAEVLARRSAELSLLCVHGGHGPAAPNGAQDGRATTSSRANRHGALETPVVLSTAFAFESAEDAVLAFRGESDAYIYGRWGNPTVDELEAALAALEGAEAACVTASGMAAISGAVLSVAESGRHVVAPRSMYGESARLLRERLPRFGITTTFVSGSAESYEAALRPETCVLYLESPSNPRLDVADVRGLCALARSRGLVSIIDSTFATPFSLSPLALGADLVVHSMTKAISGHGDVIAGLVCGKKELVNRARDLVVKGLGGVLSPLSAMLVSRGLKTFALRQEHACRSAAVLAARLAAHAKVGAVHHPSLASHPGHALAREQMHAFGSVLSFELEGADALAKGRAVLDGLRLATHAVSLGDVRTLAVHPASTTHSTMPRADREAAGIGDGLLRLSVGIEDVEALWADLEQALATA